MLGNDPKRCPHEYHDVQMLDLLKSTMPAADFFSKMKPYDVYILEKGPHKFCRACLGIGDSTGRVCFNEPVEMPSLGFHYKEPEDEEEGDSEEASSESPETEEDEDSEEETEEEDGEGNNETGYFPVLQFWF